MWFLGMDVGTGGTRAVIVDGNGKLIAGASAEHAPFRTPHPGWAEQDPEDWWRAAQQALRGALAAAPEPRQPVAAIGLTGQMHGAVLIDQAMKPVRQAILHNDARAHREAEELARDHLGLASIVGVKPMPGFTGPKLKWIARH